MTNRRYIRWVLAVMTTTAALADNTRPWQWQRTALPRALLVQGLWHDHFRGTVAMHQQGLPYDEAFCSRSAYQRPKSQIIGFPATESFLSRYAVVVLANVDAQSLNPQRLALLERFVAAGGGLVVLGGYWAYSRGGYQQSTLANILPVTMPPENRISPIPDGAALCTAATATWSLPTIEGQPRAFFVQALEPRSGAVVQLMAGEKPAVISHGYKNGRVVAVALTVNGTAPDERLPFWDWSMWPTVLGTAVAWAAANRPSIPSRKMTSIPDEALENAVLEARLPSVEVLRAACSGMTKERADLLIGVLPLAGHIDVSSIIDLGNAMLPFATADWHDPLLTILNASSLADRHDIALLLLGASGGAKAYDTLISHLNSAQSNPAITGLGLLGERRVLPQLDAIRAEAIRSLQSSSQPGALDPFDFATANGERLVRATIARYHLEAPEGVRDLADLYRECRFLTSVFRNAAKRRVLAHDHAGLALKKSIIKRTHRLQSYVALIERHSIVGAVVTEEFLDWAATAEHPEDVRLVWTALSQSELTARHRETLAAAKDGIVRRFAQGN